MKMLSLRSIARKHNLRMIIPHVLKDKLISGVLIWSLRYHARDGGFYTHAEDPNSQNFPIHIPDFPFEKDIGFGPDDSTYAKMIGSYGLKISGIDPINVPYPRPIPAKPAKPESTLLSPSNIRWFGSAWAVSYQIRRRIAGSTSEQDWVILSRNASDAFIYDSSSMFSDPNAIVGVPYEYEIKPRSVDGILTDDSPLIIRLQVPLLTIQ